jgi:hypothetical membrane protein
MTLFPRYETIGRIARRAPLRYAGRNTVRTAVRWLSVDRPVNRWLVGLALLLPVTLTSAWLIGDAVQPPSYSPLRQTVSVLAGHAGTDRWIVTDALFVMGLLYLLLALRLTAVGTLARAGLAVSAACAVGVAASPEPVHGATTRHLIFTGAGAIAIAIWSALVPKRSSPSWTIGRVHVSTAALAGFLALLLWTFIETRGGSTLGIAERLSSAIQVCWPPIVVYALHRKERQRLPSTPREMS